eukprot:scaffold30582_cov70-Attheya_sp.AAC.1
MTAPPAISSKHMPPQNLDMTETPAMARKRRRDIIISQKVGVTDTLSPVGEDTVMQKKRRVSNSRDLTTSMESKPTESKENIICNKKKNQQLKYDPDVPMGKEETAAWRREQRRKRNRESAAASRQRQRDRIEELEVEVSEWKLKFEEAMAKMQRLEKGLKDSGHTSTPDGVISDALMTAIVQPEAQHGYISPCSSPSLAPQVSPSISPIVSSSVVEANRDPQGSSSGANLTLGKEETTKPHLIEKISRQAV